MRYFERRKARIEIIPMIDIMFFLLVFFVMVTLRMIPANGIASQLPQSATAQELPHPKLVITLLSDDAMEIDQRRLSPADLTETLRRQPEPEKTTVTIAGARTVTLQGLLAVMDACRLAGITQVGIAAQEAH
ncbi:ExbD/TolR family protein [Telmatospirillum siberiense]|uniref:Biopolymer transporter ExbD n=1 Tax=Telmatospirillum siberiense TaxID=382514 RepID=A0A2N3PW11_9PROT|nr:biopolymer transporter ExbD [Telmatospirillum siberiense]PKU24580.1 biopolymer transporter ExbD [Telmatospirillum siberiense]